ncbi:hypothetical protein [Streptomyces cinnamoneus]|uniref:hypothetical protein n=1 Tax=Streptomyces cinnamoneus TaxID=53446 RepID=UPI0015E47C61|nr:hypothetical protein [Streptomyces cinnamoneus]
MTDLLALPAGDDRSLRPGPRDGLADPARHLLIEHAPAQRDVVATVTAVARAVKE